MEKELELYIKANYAKLEGDTLVSVKDVFEAAWQARVPEGYVVVPKEPKEAMVEAADNALINVDVGTIDIYKAMIEAVEK